jgi:pyruvate/2-oxoglutarate dehydrogenase complex dihydrolipoamide acyltransferase (E2) component
MSEYQYYEFQTIDRPLTERELRELRALSTRARITPTSFVNVYNFGDFRGDPHVLMEKYFDAFLYFANWGTRRLMLRLPRQLIDSERTERFCPGDHASQRVTEDAVILEFLSDEEPEDDVEEGDGALGSLIPLRADLLAGDLRTLYLGWLLSVQSGDLDDDEPEPPIPAGLGELTGSLTRFADFLRIDENLIAVAAEQSPPLLQSQPSREEWASWIRRLPESEKEALLLRAAEGQAPHLRGELLQRFRQDGAAASGSEVPAASPPERRTAGALLAAAERRDEAQRRQEAERQAAEQARREREQAAARAAYLENLRGREPEIWRRVEALIETKRPKDYDQAVVLLVDLRDLAAHSRRESEFQTRIHGLRERHAMKVSLLDRLNRAGVGAVSAAK